VDADQEQLAQVAGALDDLRGHAREQALHGVLVQE
jgi:hypothetical protein